MKWIENLTGNYAASAHVVDGTLILSLPQAITPVVWRMELGYVRASAMEVRAQENLYMLTLKTPKGDVHDIAPFDSRGKAVQALMSVSRAMTRAHGQLRAQVGTALTLGEAANTATPLTGPHAPAVPYNAATEESPKSRFITGVVGTLLLLGLIALFLNMNKGVDPTGTVTGGAVSGAATNTAAPTGVPMSADDFLNNR